MEKLGCDCDINPFEMGILNIRSEVGIWGFHPITFKSGILPSLEFGVGDFTTLKMTTYACSDHFMYSLDWHST